MQSVCVWSHQLVSVLFLLQFLLMVNFLTLGFVSFKSYICDSHKCVYNVTKIIICSFYFVQAGQQSSHMHKLYAHAKMIC